VAKERREDAEEEAQDAADVVDDQSDDVDDQKDDDDESPRGKWCCSLRCGRGELQGEDRASERLDAIDDVGEAQSGKFSEDVGDVSGETLLGLRRRRRRRSRRRRSSPGAGSSAAWARRLCRRRVGAGSDVEGGSTTLAPLTKTYSRGGSAGAGRGVTVGKLAVRGSRGQPVS